MTGKLATILAAALIVGSASIASAATVHKQVKHHGQSAIMLLENRPAGAYGQNEANTQAAERFQEQFDNSY
jgi:hypothetical protein